MTLALIVSVMVLAVAMVDWVYLRRHHKRALLLEFLGFATVVLLSLRPDWFSAAAASVGIGRGVDLFIYPMLIWLFREAVLGRVRYYRHVEEITQLVRHLAMSSKLEINGNPGDRERLDVEI